MRYEAKVILDYIAMRQPFRKLDVWKKNIFNKPCYFLTSQGHAIIFNPDNLNLAGVFAIDIVYDFENQKDFNGNPFTKPLFNRLSQNKFIDAGRHFYSSIALAKLHTLVSKIIEGEIELSQVLALESLVDKDIKMFRYYKDGNKVYTPLVHKDKILSNIILKSRFGDITEDNIMPNYEDADYLYNVIISEGVENLRFVGIKNGKLTKKFDYILRITDNMFHDVLTYYGDEEKREVERYKREHYDYDIKTYGNKYVEERVHEIIEKYGQKNLWHKWEEIRRELINKYDLQDVDVGWSNADKEAVEYENSILDAIKKVTRIF